MVSWLRAHGTIAGAVLIASGLTLAFGYVAVDSLLGAFDPERLDSDRLTEVDATNWSVLVEVEPRPDLRRRVAPACDRDR